MSWERPPISGEPVFERDGQLFLDPSRLAQRRWPLVEWATFELNGILYELWGRCPNGTWWVGRVDVFEIDTKPSPLKTDPRARGARDAEKGAA